MKRYTENNLIFNEEEKKQLKNIYQELKNDFDKFIPVSLCVIGEEMVNMNAETLDTYIECTIGAKRYKVIATHKIIKL